jgi:dTMP kinase
MDARGLEAALAASLSCPPSGLALRREADNVRGVARGRFITLEGGEGVGKSTQARRLAHWLGQNGREVVVTREPGGSPGAEAVRELLVYGEIERWSPISEALLMYAARRDHIERVIEPALARGAWVVCDRFLDSTRAYQGDGGGAPAELLAALETHIIGACMPDLTLVLDMETEVGLERAAARGDVGRFEAKGSAYHERLREAFIEIAITEFKRCVLLDASGSAEAVGAQIWAAVSARLPDAAGG